MSGFLFSWPYVIVTMAGLTVLAAWLLGLRYIPHNRVGIVEKLWSLKGSLREGRIIALRSEAGYQGRILRGGLHFLYFPWQYRIHRQPLVTIAQGKVGYVYARDGHPLPPTQTLGRNVACNNFQDARAFLDGGGERGRQRGILREGVYAVNLALFAIITDDHVYQGPIRDWMEGQYRTWQSQLSGVCGFDPIVIGSSRRAAEAATGDVLAGPAAPPALDNGDDIGIVTVHDGPPIESGEIIAPETHATAPGQPDHHYFQDPEAFLALGGRRGKQLQVLTDGTFFINRWFATVELKPKTVIPIGYVGVVVSYYGVKGEDLTGTSFRYGEQVERGHRGVWKTPLPPGKYPLNAYAMKVELVPTVNFVLRWVTGMVEEHQYDKDLTSIALITADGYEPLLPLSLVLHIDYEKAPRVVQRFGDVKRLISQTLDPILSAYFRDVAQTTCMLDLLTRREEIQRRATEELGRRFQEYDINCVAVLIGRPESQPGAEAGHDPIEDLYNQLRQRRLAQEQVHTFARQQDAAVKLKELNEARAAADKQTELTQTKIDVEVAANKGEAQLAEAQRLARRDVARAEGESRARRLLGRGEAARIAQTGLAEAAVFLKKIRAFGDPRLFSLGTVSEHLAQSRQPLVPERLLLMGGGDGEGRAAAHTAGLFGQLLALLLAERAGVDFTKTASDDAGLEEFVRRLSAEADPAGAPESPDGPVGSAGSAATAEPQT
jgi:uncharacterized membrane protein YqiK